MAFMTLKEIRDNVIPMLGQVGGSSVQQYTEPMVDVGTNRIFEYLFNKRKWEHLWTWQTATITNGKFASALTDVNASMDVASIIDLDTEYEIGFPTGLDHMKVSGSTVLYRTELAWNNAEYDNKFFQFWPQTASANVAVFCSHRPTQFEGDNDIIPFDSTLMLPGVTWWMLQDDGLNPASAEKAQVLFDTAYQDVIANINARPIGRSRGRGTFAISGS